MTRKCRECGKTLGSTCDHCGHMAHDSVNHPGTLDCSFCHRSAMLKGRPVLETCTECEILKARGANANKSQQV